MVRALYAAYFEFGLDLGDPDTLVRIAAQMGLDPEALRRALQTDAGRAEVLADVEWSRQLGVTGVPFFLFDGKFWLTGAQPPEMLLKAFEHVTRQPR
jgi:predicted DsbA family dithiol-disulfide isomerase